MRKLENKHRSARQLAILSYAIRRMQRKDSIQTITTYVADQILQENRLPHAGEQIDEIVLYLGENLVEPGVRIDLRAAHLRSIVGAMSVNAVGWLLQQSKELNLVEGMIPYDDPNDLVDATLTISGWQRYQELLRVTVQSKRGFMAMKFNDSELNKVFFDHFKPAAARAGYELFKLDDHAPAGLIDDRLRLEIRRARFLVADLTHGNPGAYWEAGYAEGLGRPVIYTCRKDIFKSDDPKLRPHFDTNHHLTIEWDPDDLAKAGEKLTVTIRATLPSEAKLED